MYLSQNARTGVQAPARRSGTAACLPRPDRDSAQQAKEVKEVQAGRSEPGILPCPAESCSPHPCTGLAAIGHQVERRLPAKLERERRGPDADGPEVAHTVLVRKCLPAAPPPGTRLSGNGAFPAQRPCQPKISRPCPPRMCCEARSGSPARAGSAAQTDPQPRRACASRHRTGGGTCRSCAPQPVSSIQYVPRHASHHARVRSLLDHYERPRRRPPQTPTPQRAV